MKLFSKKKEDKKEFSSSGWDFIIKECERIYPGQKNPKHYATLITWVLGGNDPLDGISVYDGGDYWHFVTFGLTELYEKESKNKEVSGYGMEFTFKLKKEALVDEEAEIKGICGILQHLARLTFIKGEIFDIYEYLYTGQSEGIDVKMKSNIKGLITIPDTSLNPIDTPNGKVKFVEFVGVTNEELLEIQNKKMSVSELYKALGSDVTDFSRDSIV